MENTEVREKRLTLTLYRVRDKIYDVPVENFEDVIAESADMQSYNLIKEHKDYEARLYFAESDAKKPPWLDFLEFGFGKLDMTRGGKRYSAVLLVKMMHGKPRFYAFTFGGGRFLLRPGSYTPNFGLKTSLNAIYQAVENDPARLKTVDAKTVADNTLYSHVQSDHQTTFDTFGVDVYRDILKGVTGSPAEIDTWGTRVSGADSFHLNPIISFDKIGVLCNKVEKFYKSTYYKEIFAWIDNVGIISDRELIKELEDKIETMLRNKDIENLELAPPLIVDWDNIAYFKFSSLPADEYYELELLSFLGALEDKGKLSALSIKQLHSYHRVKVFDGNDQIIFRWPVFKCLSGEIKIGDKSYLICDGDFFEVTEKYMKELNGFVGSLKESEKELIASEPDMPEGEYNSKATESSDNFLLLDKEMIRVNTKTTPIEICDIYTKDGNFIHVKRKLGSSSLSHLFAQGFVSGDLFLMNREYRELVLEKIKEAEKKRANAKGDNSFVGRFSTFDTSRISPGDFEVVYAIIAKWNGKTLVDTMPFFSKINLRRCVNDLNRMGYNVKYLRIPIEE